MHTPSREPIPTTSLTGHIVLVGYGRVGKIVSNKLLALQTPFLVIESSEDRVAELQREGIPVIAGNAADPEVAAAANLAAARCLLIAIPDAFEAGQIVEQARHINPALPVIGRAHSDAEKEHLAKFGATSIVLGEQEIARAMVSGIPMDVPSRQDATWIPAEPEASAVSADVLPDVLGPEADADDPRRNAPEQRPSG